MVTRKTGKPELEVVRKPARRARSAKVEETKKARSTAGTTSKASKASAPEFDVENIRIAQETLLVDLSSAIVDRIRDHVVWEMVAVDDQARIRQEARDMALHVIQQCLMIVAGNGAPSAVGRCAGSSQTSKGDLQVKVVVSKENEMVPAILQAWGHDVYLVLNHGERFTDGVDRREGYQDQLV